MLFKLFGWDIKLELLSIELLAQYTRNEVEGYLCLLHRREIGTFFR